ANHLASVIARFSAVALLEETVRANELFAAVLAHDLRNPLSAMMMAAQTMLMRHEGAPATDATGRPLSKILSSGKRMERMIEQLLDFTRARMGGGISIQPREMRLDALCGQVTDELELAHPEWTTRCESAGDLEVRWDPDRMLQVLSNLVANAGQHGTQGAPITVRLDGSRDTEVTFEVHNAGAIPPKLLPNLFDPFRSHHGGRAQGLGLGLFIVRKLVVAHGGTVEVSSSEASGTTFRVRMPRIAQAP
ncbi:MAG TPA: HAMP domain-containing sensor histidine kinase, partial [Polyangiaceae bacterium]